MTDTFLKFGETEVDAAEVCVIAGARQQAASQTGVLIGVPISGTLLSLKSGAQVFIESAVCSGEKVRTTIHARCGRNPEREQIK